MQLKREAAMFKGEEVCSFSCKGGDFGLLTPDGRLILWDSKAGGGPKREYVPSSHLASAPTCMAWKVLAHKKKKRRSSGCGEILAMGTTTGSIQLYSLERGEVIADLSAKKDEALRSILWKSDGSEIYAGGQNGTLFRFNVSKSLLVSAQVLGGSRPLSALAFHGKSSLLVASDVISLLDLDTGDILRTFMGHSGRVNSLLSLDSGLFLSGSRDDDILNMWVVENSSNPYMTLNANESARNICSIVDEERILRVAVVTLSGTLKVYEKDLDSSPSKKKKKPLKPLAVVQIAGEKDENGKVPPLPILCSTFEHFNSLRIVYGDGFGLSFEVLKIDSLDKDMCLLRKPKSEKTSNLADNLNSVTSNLQLPDTKSAVVQPSSGNNFKRKALPSQDGSLTMIDRLKLLSKDSNPKTTPPRTDSFLQLLMQGLHNKDRKLLDSVLDRAEEEVINNTVKKLPVEAVVPLIEELERYIHGRGMVNQSHTKWLKSVLLNHTAFIMSIPQCEEILSPLSAMIEERTRNYSSIIQLKGKLDAITRKITDQAESSKDIEDINDKEALLVYQNDSSDELSDVLDELLLPASDTDDNWDDEDDEDEDDKKESSDEVELLNGDADSEENDIEMDID